MKQEIKEKYDQVETRYIKGVLNALSAKWGVGKRWIREGLIEKDKLSENQKKELFDVLDLQIKFQNQQKETESKHFEKLQSCRTQ